jgi:ATP-dependent DNA ligase
MTFKLIETLRTISGTNDKIAYLKSNASNTAKRVFLNTLSPRKLYHIKAIPQYSLITEDFTLDEALDRLDLLCDRVVTGNAAKSLVLHVLSHLSTENAKVIELVIKKDLGCGIDVSNANKALGASFIKETPYMRCDLVNEKTIKKFKYPAISEVKMDGQYLNHFVVHSTYSACSRNGVEYDFLGELNSDFYRLHEIIKTDYGFKDLVFNGEGLAVDENTRLVLPRTVSNGILSKFGKGTGTQKEAEQIITVLWDFLPYDDYNKEVWNISRIQRFTMLRDAIAKLNSPKIRFVEHKIVNNFAEALQFNTEVMQRGEEGSILKDNRGLWKFHTSPYQLKMKLKFQVELEVIGFNEGEAGTKLENSLGSIKCKSSDGLLEVNVGSGWKEKFGKYSDTLVRDYVWTHKQELLHKIVTVEANDIVIDKNSTLYKLFLPTIVEFRDDKNTADDLNKIMETKKSTIFQLGQ